MKCPKCDHPKKLKKILTDYDYSATSGIPGTTLHDVPTYTCPKCHNIFHDLGDENDATDAVLDVILSMALISRQGLKFIRTQFFEETVFEFAARLNTTPQFIKELESYKKIMAPEISQRAQDEVIKARASNVKINFEF